MRLDREKRILPTSPYGGPDIQAMADVFMKTSRTPRHFGSNLQRRLGGTYRCGLEIKYAPRWALTYYGLLIVKNLWSFSKQPVKARSTRPRSYNSGQMRHMA